MTLVRKVDGGWEPLRGLVTLIEMATTARLHYRGTRPDETITVDPYPVEMAPMHADTIERTFAEGTWGESEKKLYGIDIAAPFDVPKGKHTVGDMRIVEVDGRPVEAFDVEDDPPAPPPETVEQRKVRLLADYGLTPEDFAPKAEKEADAPVR